MNAMQSYANSPTACRAAPIIIRKSSTSLMSIGQEIQTFIEDSERKVSRFKAQLDGNILSVEKAAYNSRDEFRDFLQQAVSSAACLTEKILVTSGITRISPDSSHLRIELPRIGSSEAGRKLHERLKRFKGELNALIGRSDRATSHRLFLLSEGIQKLIEAVGR